MTLCVFANCPNEGTLVPVIELSATKGGDVASCVLNGVVCESCRSKVTTAEELIGPVAMLEVEAGLLAAGGDACDPDLTRLLLVPMGQMLVSPMSDPGDG